MSIAAQSFVPSELHEVLIQLFRDRPSVVTDFIATKLGQPKLGAGGIEVLPGELAQASAPQHRADAVLLVAQADGSKLGVVVEVQLGIDSEKLFTWPIYVAGIRALLKCPTVLVVVTPDRGVAKWAGRRIVLGPQGDWMTPLVLGPAEVPAVTKLETAKANPELAVLSALTHGKGRQAVEIALAARNALGQLSREGRIDAEHVNTYYDLIWAALGKNARLALEAVMKAGYEYQSDFAKRYVAEGRAKGEEKGKAEGEAKGKADALLAVVSARRLDLTEAQRQTIRACTDLAQLDRWIARAAVASTAGELFE